MSVTRGDFLKSLGKSLPGMILGGTAAKAAHSILGKMAAASSASYPPETKPSRSALTAPVAPAVPFIRNGPSTSNRIALTFDDGPTPGVTERILDELKQRRLHATFFMIGERIAAAPDLARRVLAEGHDVGNHTYTHPHLTRLSDEQVELEIEKTEQIMARELNHRAAWLRPPYGALRQNQGALVARRNLGILLWNVDPSDWSQPGEDKIIETVLAGTTAGSIILCHDLYPQTAASVGPILDGLLERGFTPEIVTALLHER